MISLSLRPQASILAITLRDYPSSNQSWLSLKPTNRTKSFVIIYVVKIVKNEYKISMQSVSFYSFIFYVLAAFFVVKKALNYEWTLFSLKKKKKKRKGVADRIINMITVFLTPKLKRQRAWENELWLKTHTSKRSKKKEAVKWIKLEKLARKTEKSDWKIMRKGRWGQKTACFCKILSLLGHFNKEKFTLRQPIKGWAPLCIPPAAKSQGLILQRRFHHQLSALFMGVSAP